MAMKFLKNKRLQICALLLLLLLVIVIGVWWFTRPAQGSEEMDSFTHVGDAVMEPAQGVAQTGRRFTYYQAAKAEKKELSVIDINSSQCFFYKGQVCSFRIAEKGDEFSVSIVSFGSEDALRTWDADSFYEGYVPELLYIDAGDGLWALYPVYAGKENWVLFNVEAQQAVEIKPETVLEFSDEPLSSFAVWDGRLILHDGKKFAVLDLNTENMGTPWDSVKDYCLDHSGNLYYLQSPSAGQDTLIKYSLEEAQNLWSTDELPSLTTYAVSSTGADELFLLGQSRSARHEIFAIDPETGKTAGELTTLSRDLTEVPDGLQLMSFGKGFGFAVDEAYRVYLSSIAYDLSAEDPADRWVRRELYILEPVEGGTQPEETIELTITAPYVISSVDTAARVYQRDHPEVTFSWDIQYLSAEDLMNNYQEYKDQFALRAMGGGLGDVVLVNGFGLDTRIITNTDAFADLSAYLDACPFKDELQWNQVETLRGEDGAIRALPLGVVPTYYVWNQELLNQLGIDPNQVTWSELLAMALQWKEEGTDLSLAASDTARYGFERILEDILLANLYAADQPDGTVQLDQPYLRELMQQLKELMGSKQLVRAVPQSILVGSEKALFVAGSTNRNVADKIYDLAGIENGTMLPCAGAYPKGEVNKKQQGYAYCWGLNARSEKQDAAWDFLQFLISSEGFSGGLYSSNTLPLNKVAQETWANTYARDWNSTYAEGSCLNYFRQLQDTMDIPCSAYEQPYGWYDAVYVPLLRYFDDEMTLDEAMSEASANWERFVME